MTSRRSVPSSHRSHQSFYNCNALVRRCLTVALAAAGGIIVLANSAIAQIVGSNEFLTLGDSGTRVRELQLELRAQQFYDGDITGFYGEQTREAVLFLQSFYELEQDGVFGELSQRALFRNPRATRIQSAAPVPPLPRIGEPIPIETETDIRGIDDRLAQSPSSNFGSCANLSTFAAEDFSLVGELRFGDEGSEVERLQTQLDRLGYEPGPIDGIFGNQTEVAVRAFQRDQGLPNTGVAGEETQRALGFGESLINSGPYAVVIPASRDDREKLRIARREVSRACFARSRLGSYIYAGGFESRSAAENLSLRLRSLNLDSRVDFRRRIRAD